MADLLPSYEESGGDIVIESTAQPEEKRSDGSTSPGKDDVAGSGESSSVVPSRVSQPSTSEAAANQSPALPPLPLYARDDPAAQIYIFGPRLIHFTTPTRASASGQQAQHLPRYQLAQRLSRSGKPYQLHMRPLVPSEGRRLSLISTSATEELPLSPGSQGASSATSPSALRRVFTAPGKSPSLSQQRLSASSCSTAAGPKMADTVPYDEDTTLYICTAQLFFPLASRIDLYSPRPLSSRVLPGTVRMELAKGAGGLMYQVWHITRNEAGNSLRPENAAKMAKWGYRANKESKQELLLTVRTRSAKPSTSETGALQMLPEYAVEWTDADGNVLALEAEQQGRLALVPEEELSTRTKELLIACWSARCWASQRWKWDTET